MSHMTKAKVEIKDLAVLRQAAEKLGLKVTQGTGLTYESPYVTDKNCVMLFQSDKCGGMAGVREKKDGTYEMLLDNYGNRLTNIVGNDCSLLGREYTTAMVENQAMLMGGIVTEQTVKPDGTVEMFISLGG